MNCSLRDDVGVEAVAKVDGVDVVAGIKLAPICIANWAGARVDEARG